MRTKEKSLETVSGMEVPVWNSSKPLGEVSVMTSGYSRNSGQQEYRWNDKPRAALAKLHPYSSN